MLPVGAELERMPVPPHPKCPCLQSQLAPSRLKAECQTDNTSAARLVRELTCRATLSHGLL